jgi:hypothetical protein
VGSIRGIFLAQFHPHQGPMVRCQWPPDVLEKETFRSLSRFIIPKNEVQEQTITVNAMGYKISGYPTYLKDKKYPRNYLLFNLCIVCHPWSRTVQFEPFVRKLSQFFVNLGRSASTGTEIDFLLLLCLKEGLLPVPVFLFQTCTVPVYLFCYKNT